jgi:hypothetical protein
MCRCGYVHNLSPIPDDGYLVVRDRDFDQLLHSGDDVDAFVSLTQSLYKCPECERLAWLTPGTDKVTFYVLEA